MNMSDRGDWGNSADDDGSELIVPCRGWCRFLMMMCPVNLRNPVMRILKPCLRRGTSMMGKLRLPTLLL